MGFVAANHAVLQEFQKFLNRQAGFSYYRSQSAFGEFPMSGYSESPVRGFFVS